MAKDPNRLDIDFPGQRGVSAEAAAGTANALQALEDQIRRQTQAGQDAQKAADALMVEWTELLAQVVETGTQLVSARLAARGAGATGATNPKTIKQGLLELLSVAPDGRLAAARRILGALS